MANLMPITVYEIEMRRIEWERAHAPTFAEMHRRLQEEFVNPLMVKLLEITERHIRREKMREFMGRNWSPHPWQSGRIWS